MTKTQKMICLAITALILVRCRSGYNKIYIDDTGDDNTADVPPCDVSPISSGASNEKVLSLIAKFSCEKTTDKNRVMAGQHLGTINDVDDGAYNALMQPFANNRTTPAILSVEYAYDNNYSFDDMAQANDTIVSHWQSGGLVSISWTPRNPWNMTTTASSGSVNLNDLKIGSPASTALSEWEAQVKTLADALLALQTRDATLSVLFRPLPAMNSDIYWWGSNNNSSSTESEKRFGALWLDLFKRLQEHKVKNLLWVFSPMESGLNSSQDVDWGFDSIDTRVDIVAGIARNDQLNIKDYKMYSTMDKPLGMSELSPQYDTTQTTGGKIDTLNYKNKLTNDYPYIAYWISWNDEQVNGIINNLSLGSNNNATLLLNDDAVYTVEDIETEQLR